MKKLSGSSALLIFFMLFFFNDTFSQEFSKGESFFTGTWDILAKALPQGDTKFILMIEKKDGKISGNIRQASDPDQVTQLNSVEISDTIAVVKYNAQSMDITIEMKKKDDKSITGNILGMFDIEGVKARIESGKQYK